MHILDLNILTQCKVSKCINPSNKQLGLSNLKNLYLASYEASVSVSFLQARSSMAAFHVETSKPTSAIQQLLLIAEKQTTSSRFS